MIDYLAPLFPVYTGSRMLAAICTGVLAGLGYAIIYMQNSSTGGTDFIIMAVKALKPYLSLDKKEVVICACNNKEMFFVQQVVKEVDPAAFTVILESNEVHGEGFKMFQIGEGNVTVQTGLRTCCADRAKMQRQ